MPTSAGMEAPRTSKKCLKFFYFLFLFVMKWLNIEGITYIKVIPLTIYKFNNFKFVLVS